MYLINKDETEHTGQVNQNNSLYPCCATYSTTYILKALVCFKESTYWTLKRQVKPILVKFQGVRMVFPNRQSDTLTVNTTFRMAQYEVEKVGRIQTSFNNYPGPT